VPKNTTHDSKVDTVIDSSSDDTCILAVEVTKTRQRRPT